MEMSASEKPSKASLSLLFKSNFCSTSMESVNQLLVQDHFNEDPSGTLMHCHVARAS